MTETITVRKSSDRGHADHGWLDTHHTFSFAGYYDPAHQGFRSLRVLNEDRVSPGRGFGTHPHSDMEIISYVVSGQLEHKDSTGRSAVMRPGDVQRISAGRGVRHSEANPSTSAPVHFLQIWIEPDERGVAPDYAEKPFSLAPSGGHRLIASKSGRDGSIAIHQDADVHVARLKKGESLKYDLASGRAGWVQVIEGDLSLDTHILSAGDGASIEEAEAVDLVAETDAHFLFFDLK